MKKLIVILLTLVAILLFLNLIIPHQRNNGVTVFGFKDESCGHWKKTKDQKIIRLQLTGWARGFISGYNVFYDFDKVDGDLSHETIELYYDKYCQEHPLGDTYKATLALIDDLKKQ